MVRTLVFAKGIKFGPAWPIAVALLCAVILAPSSQASLTGTVPTAPTQTVFPGFVSPGTDPGTLLASETESWSFTTTGGTTSGTLTSAVFMETGGTLDFYYQVENDPTSASAIARVTGTNFAGATISTGFRVDGGSLAGGFADGSVAPITGDLNSDSTVVGFSFNPPDSAKIAPGATSNILVVSTDATKFTSGNASVIDGGTATVASYQPGSIPEPATFLLLGGGLLALSGLRLRRR
jgi:hypothetical protein